MLYSILAGPIYGKYLNKMLLKNEAVMRFWLKRALNENNIYLKNPKQTNKQKKGCYKKALGAL